MSVLQWYKHERGSGVLTTIMRQPLRYEGKYCCLPPPVFMSAGVKPYRLFDNRHASDTHLSNEKI